MCSALRAGSSSACACLLRERCLHVLCSACWYSAIYSSACACLLRACVPACGMPACSLLLRARASQSSQICMARQKNAPDHAEKGPGPILHITVAMCTYKPVFVIRQKPSKQKKLIDARPAMKVGLHFAWSCESCKQL